MTPPPAPAPLPPWEETAEEVAAWDRWWGEREAPDDD